ncbi:T9SS type A sorting domain-containing protein [uncultured Tenacibaculum sp.]|uniref:T9SS type A sorting domain-containing protein n=1 Tax=uncultured Tenacibaculum sp. TaxID=174713 RepID=UPI00261EF207|nr:T9SS type A sorting domain-containing protein [uncultured Tenacibaculum sp.]
MKKVIIRGALILSFFINHLTVFSQTKECGINGEPIVKSGAVFNLNLVQCNNDLTITTLMEDTSVSGYIKVSNSKRIRIIPKDGYQIRILAVPNSSDDADNSEDSEDIKNRPGDRTKLTGTKGSDRGKTDLEVIIYPNPVENILNIKSKVPITNYKILNTYGNTILQGGSLHTNATISVNTLTKGMYFLIVQAEDQIITEIFYKN